MTDMFLLLCKSCRVRVARDVCWINIHTGIQNYGIYIYHENLKNLLEWIIPGYKHKLLGSKEDFDFLKDNIDDLYFEVDNNFIRLYKLNPKAKSDIIAMAKYNDPNWVVNFKTSYQDYIRSKKNK